MELSELCFDSLEPVEVPVAIGQKRYVLREASADAAAKFRSAASRAARFNEEGKLTHVEGLGETELVLVANCLCFPDDANPRTARVNRDGVPFLVGINHIRTWKEAIVKQLFDKAKEISPALEEKETIEAIEKRMAKDARKLADLKRVLHRGNGKHEDASTGASEEADPTQPSPASGAVS